MSTTAAAYGRMALLANRDQTEERIRRLHQQGWTVRGLADLFGVHISEVERITGDRRTRARP